MHRPSMYTRPNKPLIIEVKDRKEPSKIAPVEIVEPVIVDKATECHVTPDDVAERMVEYLGEQGDYLTLEPSAGTGQLVKALLASGHSDCELTAVERHFTLANQVSRLCPTITSCFLEYAEKWRGVAEFPRVIMNPPFKSVKKHVAAALSLMGRGGHDRPAVLVALVPITFKWEGMEELEILPSDTFSTAKVHTKIIRIEVE